MEVNNFHPINTLLELPIELLHDHPDNPPERISEDENLLGMMRSVKSGGIHEPLIVTPSDLHQGKYKIICGHRRRRASVLAGLIQVPCIIRIYDSTEQERCAMLIENTQRKSLLLSEQADSYFLLLNGISPTDTSAYLKRLEYISGLTGISPSRIDARISIRNLIPAVRQYVDLRIISLKKAKILAGLAPTDQAKLVIKAKSLSDVEFARLVAPGKKSARKTKSSMPRSKMVRKAQTSPDRIFSADDEFSRDEAIESLHRATHEKFSRKVLIKAFNDVCEETCSEAKNDLICRSCPVPRFVKSVVEREKLESRKHKNHNNLSEVQNVESKYSA